LETRNMRIKVQFIHEQGRTRVRPVSHYPSHYRVQMQRDERGKPGTYTVMDVEVVYKGNTPFLRKV